VYILSRDRVECALFSSQLLVTKSPAVLSVLACLLTPLLHINTGLAQIFITRRPLSRWYFEPVTL